MNNYSGGFYNNVLRNVTQTTTLYHPIKTDGTVNPEQEHESYIVGRKDISGGVEINPFINDTLTFDLSKNGSIIETVSLTITAEHYTPSGLVQEINDKLNQKGINYVRAEYGSVNTGTTADDSNKLVLRYINEDNGNYVIDGVRGSSAYSIFYNSSGEPTPSYTIGVLDLSQGVEIVSGENDTFSFNVDGKKFTVKLAAGEYNKDEILEHLNNQLDKTDSNIVASYYEKRLKLGYKGVGAYTIDGIGGNAAGTLFLNMEQRQEFLYHKAQIGPNSGASMQLGIFHTGENLLRITTTQISSRESAERSLERLDYALAFLSGQRANAGVYQNRLEHMFKNSENYTQNLKVSESKIRDTDMAKETLNSVKGKIMEEASYAMFANNLENSKRIVQLLA